MKYIPGTTITVTNTPLKGSIKGYFKPGGVYYIKNIKRNSQTEIEYVFQGEGAEFSIKQQSFAHGDIMIDYLLKGVVEQQTTPTRERKD